MVMTDILAAVIVVLIWAFVMGCWFFLPEAKPLQEEMD